MLGFPGQNQSLRCWPEAPFKTLEQMRAGDIFKPSYRLAGGRLRDVQFCGGMTAARICKCLSATKTLFQFGMTLQKTIICNMPQFVK